MLADCARRALFYGRIFGRIFERTHGRAHGRTHGRIHAIPERQVDLRALEAALAPDLRDAPAAQSTKHGHYGVMRHARR